MKLWYIYKITNLITGKAYVGQRYIRDGKTSLNDNYWGSGLYIKRTIKKYGLNNFKKEILKDNIRCQTAANIFEQVFIKKENTLTPNGYNLTTGGSQCEFSEESKKKNAEAHKGRISPRKGVKLSRETKKKLSESHKGNSYRKGKKCSEETKRKMRLAKQNISKETRDRMSVAAKNKPAITEETRQKLRMAIKNMSDETRQNISIAAKNKPPMSEETKRKLSKNHKGGVKKGYVRLKHRKESDSSADEPGENLKTVETRFLEERKSE